MLLHNIANSLVPQTDEPQLIAGKYIPTGYLNGTLICKNHNKRNQELGITAPIKEVKGFLKYKNAKEFILALNEKITEKFKGDNNPPTPDWIKTSEDWIKSYKEFICSPTSVIIIKNQPGIGSYESGTWVHPILGVKIAGYCDPKFEILANELFLKVVHPDFNPDDAHFKELRSLGQQQWERVRLDGKIARRCFTDCLKEHLIATKDYDYYNSAASSREFAKYTAISQNKLTGFPNFNGNRDNCTEEQLKILDHFETSFDAVFQVAYPEVLDFDEIFNKVIQKTKNKFNL